MRLDTMLQGCVSGEAPGIDVSGLQYDSRKLSPGDAFFAFSGERVDGHVFVPKALEAGAAAIVSEREAPVGVRSRWAQVRHGRKALARAAQRFYDRPDRDVQVTAVTGTNGKTTTVHLIDSILRSAGKVTAMLGTVEHRVGDTVEPSINTTPESLDITRYLARLRDMGGTHATMEASSHALEIGRIHGFEFHTAVFTNLTPEHLDFHGNMANYMAAKRRLFEGAGAAPPSYAVANADDEAGREILALGRSSTVSYGVAESANVRARRVQSDARGLSMDVETPSGTVRAEPRLVGDFNVENVLAAIAVAQCHGLSNDQIESSLRQVGSVPGRFEIVDCGQPFLAVVDYAHTPDALRRLIEAARVVAQRSDPPGRVLTLFGCGGDRDRTKRAPMGRIAGRLADVTVLTSDNPRSEDPLAIMRDVEDGLRRVSSDWLASTDRAEAISALMREAQPGDIALVAGKGHETQQVLATGSVPFDDRAVTRSVLAEMGFAG